MVFLVMLIFAEKNTPARIAVWALTFILLPFLGFVLYLFIGQTFYSEQVFKLKGANDEKLRGLLGKEKGNASRERNPEYRSMGVAMEEVGAMGYSDDNDVRLYTLGEDKFEDLYEDLREAKEHINFEYYIIRDDELGNELIDILTKKVEEGVEVRLLTDGFGFGKGPRKAIKRFQKAGGQFALFHRVLWLLLSPKKNNRNHRKIAVIDGKVAYCGGFNVGDEYLGKGPLGFWRDTSVRVSGGSVDALQLRFQMDWEYATGAPMCTSDEIGRYYRRGHPSAGDARVMSVSGGPDVSDFNPVRLEYLQLISRAKKSVYIHSPYFIPDDSLTDALTLAVANGVDVKVIMPDKPDHMFVYWNNIRSAYAVAGKGVKVYKYNRGFVHSKTLVIDGEYCSVGSANFDDRSMVHNFETNLLIMSPEIGRQMDEAFLEDLSHSTEYDRSEYENLDGYQLLRVFVSRLIGNLA